MSHGLLHPAVDADELLRRIGLQPGGPLAMIVEHYLQHAYSVVFEEGREEGRLDQMVGGTRRAVNPYRP